MRSQTLAAPTLPPRLMALLRLIPGRLKRVDRVPSSSTTTLHGYLSKRYGHRGFQRLRHNSYFLATNKSNKTKVIVEWKYCRSLIRPNMHIFSCQFRSRSTHGVIWFSGYRLLESSLKFVYTILLYGAHALLYRSLYYVASYVASTGS